MFFDLDFELRLEQKLSLDTALTGAGLRHPDHHHCRIGYNLTRPGDSLAVWTASVG
jgi:hypothetical protein